MHNEIQIIAAENDNGNGLRNGLMLAYLKSAPHALRKWTEAGLDTPCSLTVWIINLIAWNVTRALNRAKHTYSTRKRYTMSWHILMTRKKKNKNARSVKRNFMTLQLWTITCVRSMVLSSNASIVTCTARRAGRSRMPWRKVARNFGRYCHALIMTTKRVVETMVAHKIHSNNGSTFCLWVGVFVGWNKDCVFWIWVMSPLSIWTNALNSDHV